MSAATYLGLDAGGTRSRWVLCDADARLLGGGEEEPMQASALDPAAAAARLRAVLARIVQALPERRVPTAAVAGIAGAGDAEVREALRSVAGPVAVVGDTVAAAAAALGDRPGVLVWAGTGSFALARAEDGALHRAGGRGPWLGDEGSGHDLVRRAASAAVRAADGRGPATALGDALAAHFRARSVERLGAVLARCGAGAVAAASTVVTAVAADGDRAARAVLAAGAAELADLAHAAARGAGLDPAAHTVAPGGGLLHGCAAYRALVEDALRARGFAGAGAPIADAAVGAARLARAVDLGLSPLADWVRDGAA